MKNIFLTAFLLFAGIVIAQEYSYPIFTIPKDLQENANACLRLDEVSVNVSSRKSVTIKKHRVLTVFNKLGDQHQENYEYYDNVSKIKSIEVRILDAVGKEIKKFKKKDFSDTSVADGAGSISDSRRLVLDFTPTQYPYTIDFYSEIETDNSAFLRPWVPLDSYFLSVEHSKYTISYPTDLGFRFKESNFEFCTITKNESAGNLMYEAKNIQAIKREDYTPSITKFLPIAKFSLTKFHLAGVDGEADSWESFGKWMNDKLLSETDILTEEGIKKIQTYVGNVSDPIEKAKLVFKYVQDNTRYVSIQLGIGGWKPMNVKDVDRLGYGDCKALTNYARALLKAVGVPSYYAIIYLDRSIRNIDPDFVSMEGNHATLAIPIGNELCWAECTSQTEPFNFQALSTDDRTALIVDEKGGRIVKTNVYKTEDNSQITKAKCSLTNIGTIDLNFTRTSKGTQYAMKSDIELETDIEKRNQYKSEFNYINDLNISDLKIKNNKDDIVFIEEVSLSASKFAQITADRILVPVNITNRLSKVPAKNRNRVAPFEISRGYYDEDQIEILFPEGYQVEAKSENIEIVTKFGTYITNYQLTEKGLIYKRIYQLNNGMYSKEDYESFRNFLEQVVQNDQAKILLKKI